MIIVGKRVVFSKKTYFWKTADKQGCEHVTFCRISDFLNDNLTTCISKLLRHYKACHIRYAMLRITRTAATSKNGFVSRCEKAIGHASPCEVKGENYYTNIIVLVIWIALRYKIRYIYRPDFLFKGISGGLFSLWKGLRGHMLV